MDPGKLSQRVKILRASTQRSDIGEIIQEWHVIAEVWAQAYEVKARELIASVAKHIEITTRFRLRAIEVDYADRIAWQNTYYQPVQIIPIGRREGLEILAKRLHQKTGVIKT